MNYDQLILLQNVSWTVFGVCIVAAFFYVVAGLWQPRWVGRGKRLWVLLAGFALTFISLAQLVATLIFTHSHPQGPHSFDVYMAGFVAKLCAAGKRSEGCDEIAAACADLPADTRYPACVYLRDGPDANP